MTDRDKLLKAIEQKYLALDKEDVQGNLWWDYFREFVIETLPEAKEKTLAIDLIEDFDKKLEFLRWLKYREDLRKKIKVKETLNRLAKKFNDTELSRIIEVVNHSIDNQYQGLFWDKFNNNAKKGNGNINKALDSWINS